MSYSGQKQNLTLNSVWPDVLPPASVTYWESAVITKVQGDALGNYYRGRIGSFWLIQQKSPVAPVGQQLKLEHGEHRDKSSIFDIITLVPRLLSLSGSVPSWWDFKSSLLEMIKDYKQDFRRQRQAPKAPHSPSDPAWLWSSSDLETKKINLVIK